MVANFRKLIMLGNNALKKMNFCKNTMARSKPYHGVCIMLVVEKELKKGSEFYSQLLNDRGRLLGRPP